MFIQYLQMNIFSKFLLYQDSTYHFINVAPQWQSFNGIVSILIYVDINDKSYIAMLADYYKCSSELPKSIPLKQNRRVLFLIVYLMTE